jgi:8-oxo-dGTP pyrophosphatase MutT (NUDIX family)
MAIKVFIYVTRNDGRELLVFDHPEAGTQVPKGTLEAGEEPLMGARRELLEEAGIETFRSFKLVATDRWRTHVRALFHVELAHLPDSFDHIATGSEAEEGLEFRYRWVPLENAHNEVDYDMADTISQLLDPIEVEPTRWVA